MAIRFGRGGEMAVVLRVKDDGTVVVEKFGKRSEQSLGKASKSAKQASVSWKQMGVAAAAAGAVVTAALGAMVKSAIVTGARFQQSMANVASVAGAAGKELRKLSDAARAQAKVSIFTASEAADAQFFLASAGLRVNEIIEAQAGIMALAAATQADLARTSEITTATLAQFELQANQSTRVANVFAASVASSQATLQKLGDAMRFVGPVANALGEDIESATAAINLLFNAGFKGEQAGTILRAALIALQKPTSEQQALLKRLGVQVNDASGQFVGLGRIIAQLSSKQINLNEAATLFGSEAAPGMIALVKQGTDAYNEMRDAITGTNKAMEIAQRQTDTLTGDWKLFNSALEETSLTFFEKTEPTLRAIVQGASEVLRVINRSELEKLGDQRAALVARFQALRAQGLRDDTLRARNLIGRINELDDKIIVANKRLAAALLAEEKAKNQIAAGAGDTRGDKPPPRTNAVDKEAEKKRKQLQKQLEALRLSLLSEQDLVAEDFRKKHALLVQGLKQGELTRERFDEQRLVLADQFRERQSEIFDRETEARREKLTEQLELLRQSHLSEEEAIIERAERDRERVTLAREEFLIGEEEFSERLRDITERREEELTEIQRRNMSAQERLWREGIRGRLQVTAGLLGQLAGLMQSESKKLFKIGKAAATAEAIISTHLAITNALATQPFIPLGLAMAAVAAVKGFAAVQAIKKQTFGGGGAATPTFAANPSSGLPAGPPQLTPPPPSVAPQQAPVVQRTINLFVRGTEMFSAENIRDVLAPAIEDAIADGALKLNVNLIS